MTISEMYLELEMRGDGRTYAGGMTADDIESIKEESAKLREQVRAKRGS